MKLVGELKEKVKKTQDLIEAKELIAKAGMELSEDELEEVAGGKGETRHIPKIDRAKIKHLCEEYQNPSTSNERKKEIESCLRQEKVESIRILHWHKPRVGSDQIM